MRPLWAAEGGRASESLARWLLYPVPPATGLRPVGRSDMPTNPGARWSRS